ncbi:ABC transporter ATP-binding protein [Patulibacter sp.]|uniref:dipeptide ABC transporter ATP-binding protein n=1 Tax=Patulibacter sp. TaxID=1912859 RepID=UPI002728A1C3|nr:ABC transporter ATP-binding protein [Patulibacter sp.]MDO9409014.1 ABC transporter ATP-binding protein [Patulibacter sp.]
MPADITEPLLCVSGLTVRSTTGTTLVSGVDLELREGEALAIVGESGSGKSLTARSIIGLVPTGLHAAGSIRFRGEEILDLPERRRARLRGAQISMILQDPFTMLHPMRRCGAVITETLRTATGSRLRKDERRREAVRRLAEVGIHDERVAGQYPFELSGGMRQRVAIAAALAQNPQVLIADEPSTALDVTTQKEVLDLLVDLQRSRGMALILITHDLRVAFSVCQQVNVFYAGGVSEVGPAEELEAAPAHPYTLGLLLAEPPADRRVRDLVNIAGTVPTPDAVAGRCAFAARCDWATDVCRSIAPRLVDTEDHRRVACVRTDEIAGEMRETRERYETVDVAPSLAAVGTGLVRARGLQVTYPPRSRRDAPMQALRGIDIDIGPGESVGIVGESGSGKTTLGRCLTGLATPSGGSLEIDGTDAIAYAACSRDERRKLRSAVQMVFQDPYSSLNPSRTVGAALGEALAVRYGKDVGPERIGALLDRVGLPAGYAERRPVALSGGERQRVAIARAIALEPRLLICDEPVSALDVSVQAQVLTVLRDVREELGLAYLFITHDLAVVRQIADRIYVMNKGEVVESGPTHEVLEAPQHPYTQRLVASVPGNDAGTPSAIAS